MIDWLFGVLSPLVVGVLCLSLFCCVLLCVLSSFAIIKRWLRSFLSSCKRSVTLPHGAVGWSAVCDCGMT